MCCVSSRAQDVLSVGGVGRARLCDWVGGGVLRLLVVSVVLLVLVLPLTGQSDWLELPSDPTLSSNCGNLQWIVNFQSRHSAHSAGPLSQSWRWWRWWRLAILVVSLLITYPRSEAKIGYCHSTVITATHQTRLTIIASQGK